MLLIDVPSWPAHGRLWSHLISDTSFGELHAFADLVGLPARSFEGDHYDVPAERYDSVVAAGARQVSMRELVVALHSSGLRRQKRKGERVLASTRVPDAGTATNGRTDLLASTLPPPVAPVRVEILAFRRATDESRPSMLVTHGRTKAARWSLPGSPVTSHVSLQDLAARAIRQQTGVRATPSDLRLCGHLRTLGEQPAWTTYLTTALTHREAPTSAARWLSTDDLADDPASPHWWPLVGWLLDRRQPRTTS